MTGIEGLEDHGALESLQNTVSMTKGVIKATLANRHLRKSTLALLESRVGEIQDLFGFPEAVTLCKNAKLLKDVCLGRDAHVTQEACLPIHDVDKLLYWAIDNDATPEILEVLLFSTELSHEMVSRAFSEKQNKMTEMLLDRDDEFRFRLNMLDEIAITDNDKGAIMDIFKKRLMRDSEENEYILTAVRDYDPLDTTITAIKPS
ncbi:hypothetical protein OEA41_004979 [Lepraria neglecta]|uniref:Uncharacterized protein n=1 Tax=Lepraria neglecta TaxID=209136 RepID=A0AAD9Z071_9LECA|nr:hypothetical protein OEA41_004979 [Lepraria neglecta]